MNQLIIPDQTLDPEILKEIEAESTESKIKIISSANTEKTTIEIPEMEILKNAVVMRTRSRKKAYQTALTIIVNFIFYYSAFLTGFERYETFNRSRLHRDNLPIKSRHGELMLRHRFVKKGKHAAIREIKELNKKRTYDLIEKTDNMKKILLTGIFKYKFDKNGYLMKLKTRLCVQDDLQTTEQNTYAITLTAKIFKTLMIISTIFDLKIGQYDVVNAFVNNLLNEDIYCNCLDEFDKSKLCGKLKKTLYELKQISIFGYKKLIKVLKKFKLCLMSKINCLFVSEYLMLFFYVDDIVILHIKVNTIKHREFEKNLVKTIQNERIKGIEMIFKHSNH